MSQPSRSWFPGSPRTLTLRGRTARVASRAVRPMRPRIEGLESRTVMSVSIAATNNSGQGYAGLDFNQSGGYTPPDTVGAAGPSSYVETVNQAVALYTPLSTGATATTAPLSTFWFSTGGLAHADGGSSLSDPIVAYNDQIGRFVVGDQDVNFSTHVSRFDIAVSKTSNPSSLSASDWNFYQINTTESGYDADYPGNFGYNHDGFVFTLNMFGSVSSHAMVVSVNNADLAAGVTQASLHVYKNDLNDGSLRPTVMHDSVAGDPMWLVTEHGDGTSIDVIKMTNVLTTSAAFAYTNLPVAAYSSAVYPLQPNGVAITTNMDSRIQKSAEANNVLVASHTVSTSSTQDVAQWYAVDVSTGTPTLKDQGRVGAGNNTYVFFPSVDINPSGQVGMTYMKAGKDTSTDYMSMYVTGRNPGDPAGTMQAPVLVPAGTGQANYSDFSSGGRAGDLSGINVSPTDGSFWAVNEFANTEATANWGTAIANFTISSPLPSTDLAVTATGPSSVTAGTNATYTITVTNNGPAAAQGLVLTDTLPAGSVFVSMTQASGTDAFTLTQPSGKAVETATGTIASGATDTFTLVVSAPTGLANGAAFNDIASVSASNPDTNPANNTATVTGTVSNTNATSDLSVTVTGPASAAEGSSVTYTINVTNAGPNLGTGVVMTATLPTTLRYQTATTGQGTFRASGKVITFTIGNVASGATVKATVTGQSTEDGIASPAFAVSSTSPDPNTSNNNVSGSTTITEPVITVSAPVTTTSLTLTSFQTATFTHASGIESASAFLATIAWGDGTNSTGKITQSGTTYKVTGSHSYTSGTSHTITTTVRESAAAVNKFGDNPGAGTWRDRDVVRLPQGSDGSGDSGDSDNSDDSGDSRESSALGASHGVTSPVNPSLSSGALRSFVLDVLGPVGAAASTPAPQSGLSIPTGPRYSVLTPTSLRFDRSLALLALYPDAPTEPGPFSFGQSTPLKGKPGFPLGR